MTKSIVCLALLWMSGWLLPAHSQEATLSSFVPTPETAKLVLATDEWLVWATSSVVAGTERKRAVAYRQRFYINRNPDERARFVYEVITSGGHPIAGVLKDGTLVISKPAYTGEMVLVKPDDTKVETAPPSRSSQFGRHSVLVSQVSDDGVLMQAYRLDPQGVEPVYFVPWSSRGVDFDRKFLVTDEKGALTDWVSLKKEKVVTLSRTKLQVFDLATRKRVDYPAKLFVDAYEGWHPGLQASDGETMVFGSGLVNGVHVTPIFDLRTGKLEFRSYIPDRVIAVKDRIIYSLARREGEQKDGIWPQALVSTDLDSASGEQHVSIDVGYLAEVVYIVRQDGLSIWIDKEWKRLPWLSRK